MVARIFVYFLRLVDVFKEVSTWFLTTTDGSIDCLSSYSSEVSRLLELFTSLGKSLWLLPILL